MTDRYGVIGHPVAHSKSPVIHQMFARQTRQDISYEAFDIPPDDLRPALQRFADDGIKGLNVTVPHKSAVCQFVDTLSGRARLAGAVNTLIFRRDGKIEGDNTDGVGLVNDLTDDLGFTIEDARILILGAGGATRGIVPALLRDLPENLLIANRTAEKAKTIASDFSELGSVSACQFDEVEGQQFDLVINATSAGLNGDVPPFPESILGADTICYDLSYAMADTPFIAWAKAHGCSEAYQGWGMLVRQAAESFYLWRGHQPDIHPVRRHLP